MPSHNCETYAELIEWIYLFNEYNGELSNMLSYTINRIASTLIVLLLIAVFAFFLIRLAPGDPVLVMLGEEATEEAHVRLREQLGLDKPLHIQFFDWMKQVLAGNLGKSIYMERTVTETLMRKLPITMTIAVATVFIAAIIGIPVGVLAAVKRLTWIDNLLSASATIGISIPGFWLGLNLILVFAVYLRWLPVGGYVPLSEDPVLYLKSMFLPSFALGIKWSALVVRMSRSCMLEVLRQDYMNTARSKGLTEKIVVLKHGFRNAVIPIVTVLGLVFGLALGGAIIIETVFSIPGVGRLLILSINRRDFMVVQGIILVKGFIFAMVNLFVDLSYAFIDPRIRYD